MKRRKRREKVLVQQASLTDPPAEDLRLARLKLLFPQKASVGVMILVVGSSVALLRFLYVVVPNRQSGTELSTELAQRIPRLAHRRLAGLRVAQPRL